MSVFTIVSNITNGAGLQRDYELLRRMLESKGHTVHGEMFNSNNPTFHRSDVVIFLEVVDPRWFNAQVKEFWMVPNSEWWYVQWEPFVNRFSRVLCKTQDCYRLWVPKVGAQKCVMMGFEANDFYRPEIPRKRAFLHLAGKSETKNTWAVAMAWRNFSIPYPLTVSAFKPCIMNICRTVPGINLIERIPEGEALTRTLNENWFHLMPSKYEGYGHAIHEALGCAGVVLTTNAPPMNEYTGLSDHYLIPVEKVTPRPPLTHFYEVGPAGIMEAVRRAMAQTDDELVRLGTRARIGFLADREAFRKTFNELVSK